MNPISRVKAELQKFFILQTILINAALKIIILANEFFNLIFFMAKCKINTQRFLNL